MAPDAPPRLPRSLADDLRSRSAVQIAHLLRQRPDLMEPWPADLGYLARRAADDASVLEAMQSLNTTGLRVLEVFAALPEATTPQVAGLLPDDVHVADTIEELWSMALLWGGRGVYRIARAAQQAFGPFPCGLAPATGIVVDGKRVREAAGEVDAEYLRRLVWQDPVAAEPGPLLVSRGDRFVLPREVSLILRDGRYLAAADPAPRVTGVDPASGYGLWAPLAGVRYVLTDLSREPLARHPTRGVSRRALADRAEAMAVPEEELATWLELAGLAGLIGPAGEVVSPSAHAQSWLHAAPDDMWHTLVEAWLSCDRPLPACRPDTMGCLTVTTRPRTASHRRHILSVWPDGACTGVDTLRAVVAWHRPRMHEAVEQCADVLAEVTALGLLVGGAPTEALRRLPGDVPGAARCVDAATAGGLIVQPDHTVIAPLSVDTGTWLLLQDIAHVESWGPVTTHRIDAGRVRAGRAGRSPGALLEELAAASRTPVPQSVEYTIRDAGRLAPVTVRGATVVEVGPRETQVVADLGLRPLSDRVFVSEQSVQEVAALLTGAGIPVTPGTPPVRGTPLDHADHVRAPSAATVERLVGHLLGDGARSHEAPPHLQSADPATMVDVCRDAIGNERRLWLRYADDGGTRTDLLEPFEIRSGRLLGWSVTAGRAVGVPLSRIAAFGLQP